MAYDDIFLSAINKAHDLKRPVTPKKAASPMQSQTSNAMADMVASHVVGMLVEKINEKEIQFTKGNKGIVKGKFYMNKRMFS